jgi:hypothetical protein
MRTKLIWGSLGCICLSFAFATAQAQQLQKVSPTNGSNDIIMPVGPPADIPDATPITGSIDFAGVATFDTTSLLTASRVSLWNSSFVLQDSGSFSSIAAGTTVNMTAPWIFKPSTPTPALWSVGGFTFDLTSSTVVTQTSSFLNVTGVGTISANGFTTTPGTWSFTSSSSNGGNQSSFGFQASTSAVPEPATVGMLFLGAGLLVGVQRFRRKIG